MKFESIEHKIGRLYHEDKMSGPEIARALGVSTTFVYSRLARHPKGVRSPFEVGMLRTIKSMYGYIPSRYKS